MDVVNSLLDRLNHARFYVFGESLCAFQFCGSLGLVLGALLAFVLVIHLSLSPWVMVWLVLSALSTFIVLAMLTKIITGEERLVYYHHHVAITAAATVLLWLVGQPILPYLDITILGVGLFLTCGRIGCLMVGCCHGQPHRWGVCYREEHAALGFPRIYVNVRLFPIQGVESIWVLGVVIIGVGLVLSRSPAGEAFTWYVMAYGVGRFFFEFARGDSQRPMHLGFSEAQWTSLFLMGTVVCVGLCGLIVFHLWHAGATAVLVLAIAVAGPAGWFRRAARLHLLHPSHVKEIAEAFAILDPLAPERIAGFQKSLVPLAIPLRCTSYGLQISASTLSGGVPCARHYALSHRSQILSEDSAKTLARVILRLGHHSGPYELIRGNHGVFHVLLHCASSMQKETDGRNVQCSAF